VRKQEKSAVVEQLQAQAAEADGIILVDYRGLTVAEMTELRKLIGPLGGKLQVIKNRLLARAVADSNLAPLGENLEGPTAAVWVTGEVPAVARALSDFAKEHPALEFKRGFFDGEYFDESQVKVLATLPTRDELLAKAVGAIGSPLFNLVYSLNYPLTSLAGTLQQIKTKQEAA